MTVGDWDRRELCPDGNCVGVIGADGHCKVCGRAATNWGNERERGLKADAAPADELEDDEEYEDEDDDAEDGEDEGEEDDDEEDDDEVDAIDPSAPARLGEAAVWGERELCSDGACIGVIGDDGTCKVCGKPGRRTRAAAPSAEPTATPEAPAAHDPELEAAATAMAASLAGEPEHRALCPDGACVGVIGDDGKCKVCGKDAA